VKIAVVGGGIAGLGAAWKLAASGNDVTIFEKQEDVGGRCRTFYWRGEWLIRGAAAFIQSEQNLIEQAKALGVYTPENVNDAQAQHSWNIVRRDKDVVVLNDFKPADILTCGAMPISEKLALGTSLPMLLKQLARNDPRDPTTAADLDTISAVAYFRQKSPFFADYLLEPIMQTFCGYGEDDYSLAWLAWLMAGPYAWATGWWQFKDRGVGRLTYELGRALEERRTGSVKTGVSVARVSEESDAVVVEWDEAGECRSERFDGAVVALPGSLVPGVVDTLNADDADFFRQVEYVGHHICYIALDFPEGEAPALRRVLPTVEGFSVVSNFTIRPLGSGTEHVLYLEVKGDACKAMAAARDEDIIEACMAEVAGVEPGLAKGKILDTYVQRNDIALCRRHVGYTKALKVFRERPHRGRISYAGDYLISSSVGQAHYSGLEAADRLLKELVP
jgi:oxygen-dependent protoporphyrinogen oxidase